MQASFSGPSGHSLVFTCASKAKEKGKPCRFRLFWPFQLVIRGRMMLNSHGKRVTKGGSHSSTGCEHLKTNKALIEPPLARVGSAICMGTLEQNNMIHSSCSRHVQIASLFAIVGHFRNGAVDESPRSNKSSRNKQHVYALDS